MRKTGWLFLLLLLPTGAWSQVLQAVWAYGPVSYVTPKPLRDSLAYLSRYYRVLSPAALERTTTYLLVHYPESYAADYLLFPKTAVSSRPFSDFRLPLYVYRAEARTARGDFRGAEDDLTSALGLGERSGLGFAQQDWLLSYQEGQPAFMRLTYFQRGRLRLDHLHDTRGGCADMGRSYQLDTVRAGAPRWHGCALPRARGPVNNEQFWVAQRVYQDSLARAADLLHRGQPAAAEGLLRHLAIGQAGPFARIRPTVWRAGLQDGRQVAALLSEAARQRSDYARALAYLDTLAALPSPRPADRYQRGVLLLDDLHDPAGGCDELRWVYDHDTARTAPTHPRWRGCRLPRYKLPVGEDELSEYYRAYQDSLTRAHALSAAPALRLLTRLLNTHAAGRYALRPADTTAQARRSFQQNAQRLLTDTRQLRSEIYAHERDYARARADLDTLIRDYPYHLNNPNNQATLAAYRQRADFRTNYLHDARGGRADLKMALGPGQRYYLEDHFILKGGLLVQGSTAGLEVGLQPGQGKAGRNVGVSVGLEALLAPLVVGPKLSVEGEFGLLGGRLDVVGYVPFAGSSRQLDFRAVPQAGLSVGGLVNLFYGYALPLTENPLPALGRHRISLFINWLKIGKWGG
ncbi:hypothetical protein ACFST9_00290 [Hymenobacter monticola]|uniref:Tetratricopeptide repeat protein n=1 Tax=Hymenobacter monticola TaxID=1705399 RepID=A0ABY4BCC6_9BACT|nr:hypothetical protein [Hymenobacter monticola]UOE36799.1 hypothetical protein MTP16_25315 [Hymenobacter monticola]